MLTHKQREEEREEENGFLRKEIYLVLYFFHHKNNYPTFSEFSIINPIIISAVIKSFCKDKNVTLKFPNDIFVNGRKICGILQELITLDDRRFLIIGVGMNLITNPNIKKKI